MKRTAILGLVVCASLLLVNKTASAQGWWFDDQDGYYNDYNGGYGGFGGYRGGYRSRSNYQANLNHERHHDDLEHRAYHRELDHRDAHRYPMNGWQHYQLHRDLDRRAFHDELEHRGAHRSGAYYPRQSRSYFGGSSLFGGNSFRARISFGGFPW